MKSNQLSSPSILFLALASASVLVTPGRAATVLVMDSLQTTTTTDIGGNQAYNNTAVFSSGRTPPVETDTGARYHQGTYGDYQTTALGATPAPGQALSSVVLAIAPLMSNSVYTLTIDESGGDNLSNGSNLAQLGFDNEAAENTHYAFYSSTGPSVAVLANGNTRGFGGQDNVEPYANGTFAGGDGVVDGIGGPNVLKIVLDTTGPNWMVSNYVNNVYEGSYTYTTNPTINAISFADGGGNPIFSNLELTVTSAVPEPATWAYLISGLALFGICLRRKRCQV